MAALLTLADALDFHQNIGVKAKEARLRHLTARWTDRVRGAPGVELLVAEDPRLRSALGSFRLAGRTSLADNRALARRLLDDFGIFTVERAGPSRGACVRATPGVFSAAADVDRLADAIVAIARAAGPGIRP
jgi:selenocysteine lyase/cysteine desulfurase